MNLNLLSGFALVAGITLLCWLAERLLEQSRHNPFYQDGYQDGVQEYRENPGMTDHHWLGAQEYRNARNCLLTPAASAQNWAGFVDGYCGYDYGHSLYASLDQFEEDAQDWEDEWEEEQ
jgi:hypothetical protein